MLEVKNLSVEIGEDKILDNISFRAKSGEAIVITGKSGCGKSSVIKAINGIFPYHQKVDISGDILLNGESIFNKNIQDRSEFLTTVFQNPNSQFYCVNSTDEIAFPLENRNVDKDKILNTMDEHMKMLNTSHLKNKFLFDLSGGQKQLVAITSVSVMNEEVYLLDEPSASLDQESIQHLAYVIGKWKEMGKIIIIAEHRLYYLKDLLNNMIVIENSKINDKPTTPLRSLQYTDINKLKEKHKYNKYNSFTKQKLDKHMMMSNYKYSYGKNKVIDLDIAFDDKKITFLIGKNGVGKTTFINCMCGLKKGFKGKTELNNLKFNKKGYKHCSLVMQDVTHQLFTESVYEELKLATDNEKMIADILETLKLTEKKEAHPMSLSGGEKQRVAVANAWASGKEIIIFDEPTSGLCYESMMALKSIVENLKKAGKKIIIVTHDYEFINCFDNEEIVEIYK